jgi:outer membrane protein assembly factor BamB
VIVLAVVLAGCDWPMFRSGPERTGFTPDLSISKDAVASGLTLDWASLGGAGLSSPAVAAGKVYVVGQFGSAALTMQVFDAAGNTGCTGTPKRCSPLWTSASLGDAASQPVSTPAVVDGVVYVGGTDHVLYAFDAAGTTNCSGVPKTCSPLWTSTPTSTGVGLSSPVVARGVVYLGSDGSSANPATLYAFDAAGATKCSGVPKTCAPLWSAALGSGARSSPAILGSVLYIGFDNPSGSIFGGLAAFDANGVTNCSGVPKTCVPLWTGPMPFAVFSTPAVAHGVVYVANNGLALRPTSLYAFDAAGGTAHCSGTGPTKTCAPLWTAPLPTDVNSSPAVAAGTVWIGGGNGRLYAFDAGGNTNCSGSPKTCTPLRIAVPTTAGSIGFSSPTIASGVIYVGMQNDSFEGSLAGTGLYAYDETGNTNCSGSPKTCSPLWTVPNQQVFSSPVVANGHVFVNGDHLEAFKPR